MKGSAILTILSNLLLLSFLSLAVPCPVAAQANYQPSSMPGSGSLVPAFDFSAPVAPYGVGDFNAGDHIRIQIINDGPVVHDYREAPISDGLYLVLREADTKEKLAPIAQSELVLFEDYHFLDLSDLEKPRFLALSRSPFIPFAKSALPQKAQDNRGRSKLLLTLSEDEKEPLRDFTAENIGKTLAIVIRGQVVTTHKIREVITDGRIQVTRCSDSGCDAIYSLIQDHKGSK